MMEMKALIKTEKKRDVNGNSYHRVSCNLLGIKPKVYRDYSMAKTAATCFIVDRILPRWKLDWAVIDDYTGFKNETIFTIKGSDGLNG